MDIGREEAVARHSGTTYELSPMEIGTLYQLLRLSENMVPAYVIENNK